MDPDPMLDQTPLPALLELLPLDDLPRTGWVLAGVPRPESIAGHSLGVAQVALALAPACDPPLALDRVLAMAVVHDAPEARTGDLPRPVARHLPGDAKRAMESSIADELLVGLSGVALEAWHEYQDSQTRESRFVHLCDKLQLGVRLVGYLRAGQRGLESFSTGLRELDCSEFATCEALHQELLGEL
jgi:putative hydrolases of HD superfamily